MDNLEKLDIENNQQSKTASLMKTLGYSGSSTINGSTENDQETVLSKPAISILSIQLTAIQNSFSELKTYNNNISKINKEVIRAQQEATKEKNIEKGGGSTAAPMESSSDGITALFPSLTKALKELSKTFEEFNQTNSQNQMSLNTKNMGSGSLGGGRRMPSAKLLAGGAAAVGVGALGYSMFSSDSAQAAEPKPPTIEPTISPTTKPEQPVVEKALEPEALQPVVKDAPEPKAVQLVVEDAPEPKAVQLVVEKALQPEALQPVVEDAPEPKALKAEPPVKKVSDSEKKPVKETEDINLTKKVENLAKRPVSVTRTEAPTVIKTDYADKVASFINGSYKVAQERVSSISSGSGSFGAGGAFGDESGDGSSNDGGASPSNTAEFIGFYEGFIDKARDIGDKVQTLGFGHVIQPNEVKQGFIDVGGGGKVPVTGQGGQGTAINKAQALSLLQTTDLPKYEKFAKKGLGSGPYGKLNEGQKTAVISYTYNAGPGGIIKLGKAGLVAAINQGDANAGGQVFKTKGNRLPGTKFEGGLTKRRNAEGNLFASGKLSGAIGSAAYKSGSQSRVTEYASGAVQGMTSQQGQMQLGSMGIRGSNGNLQASQLASLTAPGTQGHRAAPPAAASMSALIVAAARQGIKIGVTDSYRSFASQVRLKKDKPGLAATPGRSNHGWGLAFDLSDAGRGLTTSSAAYKFLKTNGPKFGIYGPLAKPYEIWHWEYRGGGSTNPPVVPVSAASQIRQANQPAVQTPAGATINSAAINTPKAACVCPEPGVVGIPMGGGGANPAQYLQGIKPPKASKGSNSNTAEDYRIYFRAA